MLKHQNVWYLFVPKLPRSKFKLYPRNPVFLHRINISNPNFDNCILGSQPMLYVILKSNIITRNENYADLQVTLNTTNKFDEYYKGNSSRIYNMNRKVTQYI